MRKRRYKVYEIVGLVHYSCSPGPVSIFQVTFIMLHMCVCVCVTEGRQGVRVEVYALYLQCCAFKNNWSINLFLFSS